MYGFYKCGDCGKTWESSHTYCKKGTGQVSVLIINTGFSPIWKVRENKEKIKWLWKVREPISFSKRLVNVRISFVSANYLEITNVVIFI